MAHGFNNLGTNTTFATRKEIAWHGLGKVVDAMTSEEAIKLGGLDFEVAKQQLTTTGRKLTNTEARDYSTVIKNTTDDNSEIIYNKGVIIPDKFATIRLDTFFPLGVVGSRYEVFQNIEAFDFIDSIIGKGVSYETVGALGYGETVFITVKASDEWIVNKDLIDRYLLITTSHDGSSSIKILFTPIRVVCNNTLTAAINNTKNSFTITHSKNLRTKLDAAKKALGLIDVNTRIYDEVFNTMLKQSISDEEALNVIISSLGILPPKEVQEVYKDKELKVSSFNDVFSLYHTRSANTIMSAFNTYQEGVGQQGIVGTKYGVYQGISNYLQNVKEYQSEESKFKNQFISGDTNIRHKAIELLT